ncbi:hypothetical protein [Streptomyces sp. AK010]|uniref:hypothetical protein n=1 Tax=Streptomyces sp. AK010 TaxID=2723074 RepID=UPI001607FFC7|nr:hypothetical protein [Streptomyces sp. AK010]MBB6415449.1 hypothetical protein [Streptomyces sp. AK010]
MVIIAVSVMGLGTDFQMPVPTPPTSPAAAPHAAWTGMAAAPGDTCVVVVMVSTPLAFGDVFFGSDAMAVGAARM